MHIVIVTCSKSSMNSVRPEAEMFINFYQTGHKVTVFTQPTSFYGNKFQALGMNVIDCVPQKKICLNTINTLRQFLKTTHVDIIFATNSKSIPNAAFASIGFNAKLISYRGTTGGLYRHDPTAYLTHLHPAIDGIVCVSDTVKEDVKKRVWKNKNNVVTVHKGHELTWYEKPPADLSEFNITADDFVIICAVNARPSKGIPVLLAAIEQVTDIENIHLLLVGKNMDQYQELIDKSTMASRIHKTGYRHDAPELIAASNVLVQPSISGEGLPRAIMESLSYGTPPIITTTGGGKEIIKDGINGFIVPTNDASAIARHLRDLAGNKDRLSAMSKACRNTIADEFSCKNSTEKYIEYFTSLLNA